MEKKKVEKNEKKEYAKKFRTTWTFCPVTRIVKSKKVYDRKKNKVLDKSF